MTALVRPNTSDVHGCENSKDGDIGERLSHDFQSAARKGPGLSTLSPTPNPRLMSSLPARFPCAGVTSSTLTAVVGGRRGTRQDRGCGRLAHLDGTRAA